MKICNECKRELDDIKFCKYKKSPDGLQYKCIECMNKVQREIYRSRYKKRIKIYNKKYKLKYKKRIKVQRQEYNKLHKKEKQIYQINYRKTHKTELQKYYKEHMIEKRIYRRKYEKNKKRNDCNFRLSCNLRIRILNALKGSFKSASTIELIGCDLQNLKLYLQWTAEQNGYKSFNINNYSSKKYEIDHITPCDLFNMKDYNQQRECFNWRNMQILTRSENRKKHNYLLYIKE
jgi:hypothetical protein